MRQFLFLFGALLVFRPAAVAQDFPPLSSTLFTGPEQPFVDHPFDQRHILIDVTIDPIDRIVSGRVSLQIEPLEPLEEIVLMAAELEVDSVYVEAADSSWSASFVQTGTDSLVILLRRPTGARAESIDPDTETLPDSLDLPPIQANGDDWSGSREAPPDATAPPRLLSEPFTVIIHYHASPRKGLYFVPPYEGESNRLVQVWSQGEADGNRHWFPVVDRPHDKLTSEVVVTMETAYEVVSNGVLESIQDNGDGTRTWHYAQHRPHSAYLISVAADAYLSIRSAAVMDDGSRVPLAYWVLPEQERDAARTLGQTADILAFLTDYVGYAYPWPKYDHAFVRDFMWDGMENTGAVTLTDRMLVDERAALTYDPDDLVAHEMAHQWFGNLVTAQHWSDVWVQEGFATILSAINTERTQGREQYLLEMLSYREAYLREARDYVRPLVWHRWEHPMDIFDSHAFNKGAWVLHMLRGRVGDDVFRAIIARFLEDNAFGAVTSDDLLHAVATVTGGDYSDFFRDWVYAAGHPVLEVDYSHDAAAGRLRVVIRQIQDADLVPRTFSFPLDIEIQTLGGAERHTVRIDRREHDFTFEVSMPPRFVLPDPDVALLADIQVNQSAGAWVAQLRHALEPAARVQAARALRNNADQPALLVGLRTAFEVEQSPAVRQEIVRTVAALPAEFAKEQLLLSASRDASAEVRTAAAEGLGTLRGSGAAEERLLEMAHSEPSYTGQAAAVVALARIGAASADGVVQSALITDSFRELVRSAAFTAMLHLDIASNEALRRAREYSQPGKPTEVRRAATQFLGTLDNTRALERLAALVSDDTYRVRQEAAAALAQRPSEAALSIAQDRLEVELESRIRQTLLRTIQIIEQELAPADTEAASEAENALTD